MYTTTNELRKDGKLVEHYVWRTHGNQEGDSDK